MAAVYRMKLKPNVHHKVSRTTANQAPEVLPKKSGAVSPTQPKALVIRPVSGVYMKAKMRQTAEDGTTYGAKKASRKNHWLRRMREARTANSSGSSTRSGVVSSVKSTECHIEAQKSPLDKTSA